MGLDVFEVGLLDVLFFVFLFYVIYKLFLKKSHKVEPPANIIAPLTKQDFTVEQLKKYNGVDDPHICISVLGQIFDVTNGKEFYGIDGPYGNLAGHCATRALSTMELNAVKDEYDDLSDLGPSDLEDAREWSNRLACKYPIVGHLLAPGESPKDYTVNNEKSVSIEEESTKSK